MDYSKCYPTKLRNCFPQNTLDLQLDPDHLQKLIICSLVNRKAFEEITWKKYKTNIKHYADVHACRKMENDQLSIITYSLHTQEEQQKWES